MHYSKINRTTKLAQTFPLILYYFIWDYKLYYLEQLIWFSNGI